MAKAQKCLFGMQQPGEYAGEQRSHSDHVMPPTAPQKHDNGDAENDKDENLILTHGLEMD